MSTSIYELYASVDLCQSCFSASIFMYLHSVVRDLSTYLMDFCFWDSHCLDRLLILPDIRRIQNVRITVGYFKISLRFCFQAFCQKMLTRGLMQQFDLYKENISMASVSVNYIWDFYEELVFSCLMKDISLIIPWVDSWFSFVDKTNALYPLSYLEWNIILFIILRIFSCSFIPLFPRLSTLIF